MFNRSTDNDTEPAEDAPALDEHGRPVGTPAPDPAFEGDRPARVGRFRPNAPPR